MTKRYGITEVFYSLQGEGVRAGTPNVFVRMSGCNMQCDLTPSALSPGNFICDTEFVSHQNYTLDALLAEVQRLDMGCGWVILTGGEPMLQVDEPLIAAFHQAGYLLAIETNGTRPVPDTIDWICVSPKVAEHALKQRTAHEVKYVRQAGQGIPRPIIHANHYVISPAFDAEGSVSAETLRWCLALCKDHPPWRLSLQLHKILQVR